jgi:hypothetical protein
MNDLPEDEAALDYRPVDPSGAYVFSIREQAMHIADTRHDALGWITGVDTDSEDFCIEYGGPDKPWQWKHATRVEILARHSAGREAIDAWLRQPQSDMLAVTSHMQAEFDKTNAELTADGKDISERLARGPAPVINVLLFVLAHEQSHRTVLQYMLRMSGQKVARHA